MTLRDGTVLHRIKALRQIPLTGGPVVKKGDIGGWVESESNLSQDGEAWVGGDALVHGEAPAPGCLLKLAANLEFRLYIIV